MSGDTLRAPIDVRLSRYHDWGVFPGPWLWGEQLKILVVIDGIITARRNDYFALGMLTDILRDPAFAWWVGFEVTVARRKPNSEPFLIGDVPPPQSRGFYGITYDAFRFDQPGLNLYDYDQVWLFGIRPGNDEGPDANIELARNTPLTNAELKVLAEWMDAGGGVFATGDHDYLGASMCYRVPRVRTMRKWTNAQGVPPIDGPTRLDTNQPVGIFERSNLAYMDFDHQGDATPQPIEVVLEPMWDSIPWLNTYRPHPILCTRTGVIEHFPDHPHEGEVIPDDEVELDKPLRIPGYFKLEYPGGAGRPTPKVIAYGRTTHAQWDRVKRYVLPRRFGLIGVYDGDAVGIGRVVVDSTWHHWMSENLFGFEADNVDMLTLMAAYFRNVALWLATPKQRGTMLAAATWGVLLGGGRMEFPITASVWELGKRAVDVIGRTASRCTIYEWVRPSIAPDAFKAIEVPDHCLSCPPWEVFEQALVGGIAKQMLQVAFPYEEEMSIGGRPSPDSEAIAAAAMEGARLGHQELVRALESSAAAGGAIARAAGDAFVGVTVEAPDLAVTSLRVRVEEIRSRDPALADMADDLATIELRLQIDDDLIARLTLTNVPTPDRETGGAVLRLREDLGEVTVWRGSTLSVIVSAARPAGLTMPVEVLGLLTLTGDPRQWIGLHRAPQGSDHPWQLQVRIQASAGAS